MIIVALYNLKGGVGKTTAAVNLSYLCSSEDRPTLLFDMDPQGSASYFFRVRPSGKLKARTVLERGKALEKCVRGSDYPYLDVLPADISFRNLDKALRGKKHPKRQFARVFNRFSDEYEFLFIDCPPGISIEAENVFRATDIILLPLIPTVLSLETKSIIYDFFEKRKLDTSKILPFFSMVDKRKKLHSTTLAELQESDPRILKAYIPFTSDLEKTGQTRKPLCAISKKSAGARAYGELWEQVKERLWGTVK